MSPLRKRKGFCVWTFDLSHDSDSWDTACREKFQFTDGGPAENRFTHCPYCGRELLTMVQRDTERTA